MTAKPKLHIVVKNAAHFLRHERPIYERFFECVDEPGPDVMVHGYATDALFGLHQLPARSRSAYILPGWGFSSPLFDLDLRARMASYVEQHLDVALINRGPLSMAFAGCPKFEITGFSIDLGMARHQHERRSLHSLIHVSADYPEKDWRRSEAVMKGTGLAWEVFPPRTPGGASRGLRPITKLKRKLNHLANRAGINARFDVPRTRYVESSQVLKKLAAYDGFVHVAAPVPPGADGMYVSTLLEAGLTGALLFWHDTHGHGGFLETVFELPVEPDRAAEQIRDIAATVDVAAHSRSTYEEIRDTFDPAKVVADRCRLILEQS